MESSRGPDSGPTGGSKVIDRISIFGGVDLLQLYAVSSSSCLLSYFSSELLPLSLMVPVNKMLPINCCSNCVNALQLCSYCADKCFFAMPLAAYIPQYNAEKVKSGKAKTAKCWKAGNETENPQLIEKRNWNNFDFLGCAVNCIMETFSSHY